MDKSVKWFDTPPPSDSDTSDSPTLSPPPKPKRKRSNIFTKIRKSILGLANASDSNEIVDEDDEGNKRLKRALSMDAGLQNRISQLSSNVEPVRESEEYQNIISTTPRLIRRSNSLIGPPSDIVEQRTLSNLQSPKATKSLIASTNDTNDSILEECEHANIPRVLSLINTIDSSDPNMISGTFSCSWLAPTRKPQLFPGKLFILPKSTSVQFHCQHFNRTIRLKFHFDDILNVARGTWNEQRNQALIIDLVRGKRKTWVFVAWTDDQYQIALDSLVKTWQLHCFNQIKSRLDRKRAHLNMKYCRVLKEADQAHETIGRDVCLIIDSVTTRLMNAWKAIIYNENDNTILVADSPSYSLKHVLYEKTVPLITPQPLAQILCEQATNFMTNFRALHGICLVNDSGWTDTANQKRSFVSLVTKEEDKRMKLFKWKIDQEIKINTTDTFVLESTFHPVDAPRNSFKMIYEISSVPDSSLTADPACYIKITGQQSQHSPAISEEEVCKYFRDYYFKSLFELLQALIEESQNEFDTFETEFLGHDALLPPHYRFIMESIRTRILKANLLFTTVFLPFLYKAVHFKEYRPVRVALAGVLILILVKMALMYFINYVNTIKSRPINVEGQFSSFMHEMTKDALDSAASIHSLKLKYS